MLKRIKDLWIEKLVSGEYQQCTHYLKKDDKFCCMGVLCDIYAKENNVNWVEYEGDDTTDIKVCVLSNDDNNNNGYLPDKVAEWSGLNSDNPIIGRNEHDEIIKCSSANDFHNYDFIKIANLIQENIPGDNP